MARKLVVKLYINSDKGVLDDSHRRNMPPFRGIYGKKSETWDSEKQITGLSGEEIEVMQFLEEKAREMGFELKIIDVERSVGMVQALRDKIEETPTVIIGERVFQGKMGVSELEKALRETE